MKTSILVPSEAPIRRIARSFFRRILAMTVLTACVFVAPVIASMTHAPINKVRVPRIDSRAIENLQRWADDEKESWSEDF